MDFKIERYLPIGSIVLLKESTKRIMVIGFCMVIEKDGKETYYDYLGCLFPEGYIADNKGILFNQEDLDLVLYLGYIPKEEDRVRYNLESASKNMEYLIAKANELNKN